MNLFNKPGVPKYKIVVLGDLEEKPVKYHDKLMTFQSKVVMRQFLSELNKDPILEYDWMEI